jgi:hypothetical protein
MKCYNIHDILRVKVVGVHFTEVADSLLNSYRVKLLHDKPDIEIFGTHNIDELNFNADLQSEIFSYSAIENAIRSPRFIIKSDGGKIQVYSRRWLDKYVLELLIQFQLIRKGFTLCHAAGIVWKNTAIIFPAYPGAGKTRLISFMSHIENVGILGDEYIILSKEGDAYSFSLPLWIFYYHVSNELPRIKELFQRKRGFFSGKWTFPLYDRAVKKVKPFLRSLPPSVLTIVRKHAPTGAAVIRLEDLISKERIPVKAPIEKAISLVESKDASFKLEPYSKDRLYDEIMDLLYISLVASPDAQDFFQTMVAFSAFSPHFSLNTYICNLRLILQNCLKDVEVYRLKVPERARAKDIGLFIQERFLV